MEDINTVVEMTPEVEVKTGSKLNNVATGFCLTGAALSIGRAVYSGAKWVKGKFIDPRKNKETDDDVVEETEE